MSIYISMTNVGINICLHILAGCCVLYLGVLSQNAPHASIGQNAHFTICKSGIAFIAMAVTFMSENLHICKTYVSLHVPITWMIFYMVD